MKGLSKIPLLLWVAAYLGSPGGTAAQELQTGALPSQEVKAAASAPAMVRLKIKPDRMDAHQFWDRRNGWLFAGVGASRALDYFSTLNMRRRGRQELLLTNDVVDHHAGFAVIEAAGTAVSLSASYLFHRSGHHKLERWTSIVHIGLATSGAASNYSLKTAH